jgi:hypothetical protein
MRAFGRTWTLVILMLASLTAEARPARPREVHVTITLREQVAVRAWLEGVKADGNEARRDLIAAWSDLGLDEARDWIAKLPPDKAKALTLDGVPETKRACSLDAGEAKAIVAWLSPTKERPQDRAMGAVLLGFSDALEDALTARGK